MLQTFTVEEHTLVLLRTLQNMPLFADLRLVGGTALALRLGHRYSIDLVFFGIVNASHEELLEEFSNLGLKVISKQNAGRIHQFFINEIQVDIVNFPYPWIDPFIDDEDVKMASLKDIAAMKLGAITNRGPRKDFVDIYFLLQHFSLKQMMDFYNQKYLTGSVYNVLRSLNYFNDTEKYPMPKMFLKADWHTIKSTIRDAVANF